MSNDRDPWRDGRECWDRMRVWLGDNATYSDGEAALSALSDLGTMRHLLQLVELAAVRDARRDGRSWTEIATRLGISRQSAWERWRDLDEPLLPTETVTALVTEVVAEHVSEAAGGRRRAAKVKVPNVVGLPVPEAIRILTEAALLPIGPDPDAPDPIATARPGSVVTDQSPESGAKVPARSWVRLWISGGGDGGVREPRNPPPGPQEISISLNASSGPMTFTEAYAVEEKTD